MTVTPQGPPRLLRRIERVGWVSGAVGVLLCLLGAVLAPRDLGPAWLLSFTFWVGLPLGALAWISVHALTGGRWGVALRPALHAAVTTLPWMLLAFLALWPFSEGLFHPQELVGEAAHRRPFYQPLTWGLRSLVMLVAWCAVAWHVGRRGRPLGQVAAGVFLILHVFAVTVTAIDWVMALDPDYLSMSMGAKAFTGQLLASLALAVAALQVADAQVEDRQGARAAEPSGRTDAAAAGRHDQGNLLLALVLCWSYLAFSEWLIAWSANLPGEAAWFVDRADPWTLGLGLALVLGHFAVPFVLLLFRANKRRSGRLLAVAVWLLAMQFGEQVWLITPSARPAGPLVGGWDLAAFCAVGGLWMAWFSRSFQARWVERQRVEVTA